MNHYTVMNRVDPTRTTGLRKRYEADLVARFRRVAKAVSQELEKVELQVNAYDFGKSPRKVEQFMDWLADLQAREVLGVEYGTPVSAASGRSWQNVYIKSAYQKGLAQSSQRMRHGGVKIDDRWIDEAFMRPVHAERVALAYTRNFTDLQGITQEVDKQLSRTIALGVAEGKGMQEIARSIKNRIEVIGITRSRVLARTEVIAVHAEASLTSYKEAGLEGVVVQSEFATAGDNRVCPKCEELEGKVFSIDEAQGVIPVHPNCRCAWLPVVKAPPGLRLQRKGLYLGVHLS